MTERTLLTIKRKSDEGLIAERLQKVLATSGLASRRNVEDRIQRGDVKLNGEVATVGAQVKAGDRIEIDGKRFVIKQVPGQLGRILIYNKPDGEVTSRHDPEGRATVFEKLPKVRGARWISIGRLDINTQGLLIFTTNGDLAHRLMHPSQGFEREYVCRIFGEVSDDMIERLVQGVELDDGPARFLSVTRLDSAGGSNEWYQVAIGEGRNREVRRMWEAVGVEVSRLKRVSFGPFSLPKSLHRGELAELGPEDVERICQQIGLPAPQPVLTVGDERERLLRRQSSDVVPADKKLKAERAYLGYLGGQYINEDGRRERSSILPERGSKRDRKKPGKSGRKSQGRERVLTGEPVGDRRPQPRGKQRRGGRGPAPALPAFDDAQPRFDYDPITGTFSQSAPGKTGKPAGRPARRKGKRGPGAANPAVEGLFKSDAGYRPPKYATAIDPETGEVDGNRMLPGERSERGERPASGPRHRPGPRPPAPDGGSPAPQGRRRKRGRRRGPRAGAGRVTSPPNESGAEPGPSNGA